MSLLGAGTMLRHLLWKLRYFVIFGLVVVSAYAFTMLTAGGTASTRAGLGPPRPEESAVWMAELERQLEIEKQRPRFLGPVGDFEIVATSREDSPSRLCTDGAIGTRDASEFVGSELSKPDMWEQLSCLDGTVVATYSETGKRAYFEGLAKVSANTSKERLELLEVGGKPALLVKPPTEGGPHFLYVIARPSSATERGILIGLFSGYGRQGAVDLALRALAE